MSAIDDIAQNLPIDDIARQLGEDPVEVEQAVYTALPALLGGLQANAQDPDGEASLASALDQHDNDLATPPVNVADVDVADGEKITRHIFGDNTDQVVQRLGGTGASSSLVAKLLPILAPIVLSYLAKQLSGKGGASGAAAGGGLLGGILSQILAGAAEGSGSRSSGSAGSAAGSILGDLLGGLLGGGRRS